MQMQRSVVDDDPSFKEQLQKIQANSGNLDGGESVVRDLWRQYS